MKHRYIIPATEILYFAAETGICTLSGNKNESFTEENGGAFDY